MSLGDLDSILTNPKRLAALGVVVNSTSTAFTLIRDILELKDSDLSKHMGALTDANYVTAKKTGKGRSRQTWYSPTKEGKKALKKHIDALNALAVGAASGDR